MTTYRDLTRQFGDQWVAALKRTEDVLVSAAGGARSTIDFPTIPVPEHVAKLGVAIADRAPLPSEIVEANFELTERMLRAQRDLTLRLLSEAAPTTAAATKATSKKTAAKKTPAK